MFMSPFDSFMFNAIPTIGSIIFIIVIGGFIFISIQAMAQWKKNNDLPRLNVPATLVTKRTNVSHHHHTGMDHHVGTSSSSTSYYITFEVESGDRMEFRVSGQEYGLLIEGDKGELEFQGSRYLGFKRARV